MKKSKKKLTPEALADGAKSGLTEKDMRDLGMYSLSANETYDLYGIQSEAIAMPYDKEGAFVRAKILSQKTKFGALIDRKYTQPKGTIPKLYLPNIGGIKWEKIAKDTFQTLYITEGEKKAAAACKAGYPCIGLAGVTCYRSKLGGFLQDWKQFELDGRDIYIIFDSDIVDKPQVRWAEYGLSLELSHHGAQVSRIRLSPLTDNDKCGLDDFLVANGFPNNTESAKKAFEKLPREKIEAAYPPHLTELGNAIRFEYAFKDKLRYVPEMKGWFVLDIATGLWKQDADGEAMRCAKSLPYELKKEAEKIDNEEIQKAYKQWVKASQSERNLKATLNLASSEAELVLSRTDIDANPDKLAFVNGKHIDLNTLQILETAPEDYFMKSLGVTYDPKAKCPRWVKFIAEVMDGDKKRAQYLQRVIGYSLTGGTVEQVFFVLYGMGANGKSTLLNTLLALFGDYGRQASPQTFMDQRQSNSARSDLVRLMGLRFIATSEVESNQRISESLIKQWTGGEEIATRDLYGKTFEFMPQGKLFIATNHKPRIHGTDHAIWRRVHLIPFTRTFSEKEKDPQLQNKLQEELSGILNWALEGYKEWQEKGLKAPSSVTIAVETYKEDMDVIGAWLKEKCILEDGAQELISSLFNDYKNWAKDSEEYVFGKRAFVQKLEERGFAKLQTTETQFGGEKKKGWFFTGVSFPKSCKKFEKAATPKPRK